jgi:hypothetical protein
MSFDNEASNRDNDRALDVRDEFDDAYLRRLEPEYAAEWLESADWAELNDDVLETVDGCAVEPDGVCPHGFRSPLLVLGII